LADAPKPDGGDDNPGGADLKRAAVRTEGTRAVRPRNAASILVWRRRRDGTAELLMGVRHAKHKFMPSVLVFPGGRVDRADHGVKALSELRPEVEARLRHRATPSLARAIGVAAVRELVEETGLLLGEQRGEKLLADLGVLDYLCRAVTPATRAMRFNARFVLAPAEAVRGEITGSGELEKLGWHSLEEARAAPLAAITFKVMAEFFEWLAASEAQRAARPKIVFRGMDNRTEDA
jgi:8-oxo-dGTP pyrophosphatase MutT (NUDIX family)